MSPSFAVTPDPASVGARGFEPPTSRSRTVRSSHAELRPELRVIIAGIPGESTGTDEPRGRSERPAGRLDGPRAVG